MHCKHHHSPKLMMTTIISGRTLVSACLPSAPKCTQSEAQTMKSCTDGETQENQQTLRPRIATPCPNETSRGQPHDGNLIGQSARIIKYPRDHHLISRHHRAIGRPALNHLLVSTIIDVPVAWTSDTMNAIERDNCLPRLSGSIRALPRAVPVSSLPKQDASYFTVVRR